MEPDFSGYATKANLRCSDGRIIMPDAFKHMDGLTVPLVWQHTHNEPVNVLGHIKLEARNGDVYGHGFFNDTEAGQQAKALVKHGDVTALSIYANRLQEQDKVVSHGQIREVSLVLSGANPGALIDNVNLAHGDGFSGAIDDEAIIYTGLPLIHAEESNMATDRSLQDIFDTFSDEQREAVDFVVGEALQHAEGDSKSTDTKSKADDDDDDDNGGDDDRTVKDVFDDMTDEQKDVVYFMIGQALEDAKADSAPASKTAATSDDTKTEDKSLKQSAFSSEGSSMSHNVFERDSLSGNDAGTSQALSHADAASIFEGARRTGSIKEAVEEYALKHGITDIDVLFPDAKAVTATPEFIKRRTEWVAEIMTGTRHTPFSRIKSQTANLTLDEARAKGYVKGNLKKEEFFRVSKRTTTPQTIYKKQKLDRDDVLDITDFDVVAWLKGEMRIMLEEEVARAVLLSDGRSAGDEDKISEDSVRPIAKDDDLYVTYLYVPIGGDSSAEEIVDAMTLQRRHYRGSGNPTFFTSETSLAQLLLIKDTLGRRIYPTVTDLAAALRVTKIVAVEAMDEPGVDVLGIMVNLTDYVIGADKGGDVALFDDFDIDYNQYKYLIETRISGALVKPKSAIVVKGVNSSSTLVTPSAPTWDATAKTVTVPTVTGVTYKNKLNNQTLTTGNPVKLNEDEELTVVAVPSSSEYYLSSSANDEWMYTEEDGLIGGVN